MNEHGLNVKKSLISQALFLVTVQLVSETTTSLGVIEAFGSSEGAGAPRAAAAHASVK